MSRKHPCPYCGDAQASHIFLWWDALTNTLLAKLPAPEYLFSLLISSRTLERLLDTTTAVALSPLNILGIVRFASSPLESTSPRTRALWKAATERGYTMEQVIVFRKPSEVCRVKRNDTQRWSYFSMLPNLFPDKLIPTADIDDKQIFTRLLASAGIPVPRGEAFLRVTPAVRFFHTLKTPVIVKPRMGSRARHTTLDIRTPEALHKALRRARLISPWVVIQEFIHGDLYRATCVGGKLIGVVHFIKPSIVADGIHTVKELLAIHNAHKKHPTMTDVKNDTIFHECLRRQGLTEMSRPKHGTAILLAEHSERPNGGYFVDCTGEIPAENKDLIERAAQLTRAPIVGFDILSRDLTISRHEEPFTFIEGNRAPFIELHDIPYEGTPRDVASAVWDLWEQCRRKDKRHEQEPCTEENGDAGRRDNDEIEESQLRE